jgi:hypothetical protein
VEKLKARKLPENAPTPTTHGMLCWALFSFAELHALKLLAYQGA